MMGASYPTKKALKEAVGSRLRYVETSMFGDEFKPNGNNLVVGPCAHTNRKWYANVVCTDGVITKVT